MKKTLFLLTCLSILLLTSCTPENRVIEKPVFLVSNTTFIEVSKVTITDTTTVLDFFARIRPNTRMKITQSCHLTDEKGNNYPVLAGNGIELDQEIRMTESGKVEFQLVFPPLKRGTESIQFSENGINIWGIQVKDNQLPPLQIPEKMLSIDKSQPLPIDKLTFGEATIQGKVLDYQAGMPTTLKLMVYNLLVGYDGEVNIEISPDGSFHHTLKVLGVSPALLSLNGYDCKADIYVAPGQTSEIYLNLRENSRMRSKLHANSESYGQRFYYKGPLEGVVAEMKEAGKVLAYHQTTNFDFTQKAEVVWETYKNMLLDKENTLREKIKNSTLSAATQAYMQNWIKISTLTQFMKASSNLMNKEAESLKGLDRKTYAKRYKEIQKKWGAALQTIKDPTEVYEVLNDPTSMLNAQYGIFIRQGEMMKARSGLKEGWYIQMAEASKLYQAIKDFAPLTPEQQEQMKTLPEACQQYLSEANAALLQTIEANQNKTGYTIHEIGEVSDKELFATLIKPYRGKVILVDFWATWCGPCRNANKQMIPMKEDLKDKDIVYVYITDETSPKGTWENMITDIHGEHYRLTNQQWAYLKQAFAIEGVPTYLVVDRKGEVKYKSSGFPGVSKMKEELIKVTDF